jgi:hypothetical protein
MSSSTAQSSSSKQIPSYFNKIPGEIRNQIFSLCISHALSHPKAQHSRSTSNLSGLTVSVHSRRSGNGYLKLEGIGPLPLMVVNRQTFNEVSSLVYALVEHVSIGSNISLYLDENPNERWKFAYSLMEKRPYMQRLAKSVKVVLPRTPDDVIRTTYNSLKKIPAAKQPRKSNAMALLPGLDKFLGKFESLENLTMVIIADKRDPPNFEDLLTLYKKYGERMTVQFERRFEDRDHRPFFQLFFIGPGSPWATAWEKCVREYEERILLESGVNAG